MLSYPQIDPVALDLGPLQIHWYGLMYLIGFVGAWALSNLRARQLGLDLGAGLRSDFLRCAGGDCRRPRRLCAVLQFPAVSR